MFICKLPRFISVENLEFKGTVRPAERCDVVGMKLKKFINSRNKFNKKELCFNIWLNTANYTAKVPVLSAKSSIYINFFKKREFGPKTFQKTIKLRSFLYF